MATILRTWSYQYPWLYNSISQLAALSVGGEQRFRQLALQGLSIPVDGAILDLCCGSGQTTRFLGDYSPFVTGLDASPIALQRASQLFPQAKYVEGLAEKLPFDNAQFALVHTSVALHEMESSQLELIFREVYRVLKPGGIFTAIDFHRPTNFLFWPALLLFLELFETSTAWQWLATDSPAILQSVGFTNCQQRLYAGGSLQVIQAKR